METSDNAVGVEPPELVPAEACHSARPIEDGAETDTLKTLKPEGTERRPQTPPPMVRSSFGVPEVGPRGPGGPRRHVSAEAAANLNTAAYASGAYQDPNPPLVEPSNVPLPASVRRRSDPPEIMQMAHLPARSKANRPLVGTEDVAEGSGTAEGPVAGALPPRLVKGDLPTAPKAVASFHRVPPLQQPAASANAHDAAPVSSAASAARKPLPVGEDPAFSGYHRPLRTLTCHVQPLYTLLRERMVEAKRFGTPGVKYNGGYDDQDGHYRAIIGETILQRYVVTGKLGSGSFGKVLRCYDEKRGINVALKITRTGRTFREQAKLEVNIVLAMNRLPRVNQLAVRLLKVFDWMGHMVLSFETLSYNLFQALKMTEFKGLSLDFIRDISYQILQVLLEMGNHRPHAIIHSDLKPENVLLRYSGSHRVTLIDFGSACYAGHCIHKYIQSRFYRSPEVILHLPYDTAIDLWSLGCMMVELHTGVPLFGGRDEKEQVALFESTLGPIPVGMLQKSIKARKFYTYSEDKYSLIEPSTQKRTLRSIIMDRHKGKADDDSVYDHFISLVSALLTYAPSERISCSDALKHPFFTELADPDGPHLNPQH